jgi:hypothetical protein
MPIQDSIVANISPEKLQDTTLEYRRRTSRRGVKILNQAKKNLQNRYGMTLATQLRDVNRRDADIRSHI